MRGGPPCLRTFKDPSSSSGYLVTQFQSLFSHLLKLRTLFQDRALSSSVERNCTATDYTMSAGALPISTSILTIHARIWTNALLDYTDLDGDSEMLSSSGSESPIGARTPTFDKPTELSPPGSQTASHHESSGGVGNALGSAAGTSSFTPAFEKLAGDSSKSATQGKDAPGASWNNQRAQEEFNRALENVVDKDFSLREFYPS